jgi:hypothetical protein
MYPGVYYMALSDADALQVLRDVHNANEQALNVVVSNGLVPKKYSKVAFTYVTSGNGLGDVETVSYYGDGQPEISQITFNSDIAGNLNNKYFFIWSAGNATKYYVWFNNGTGVDPDPDSGNSTPIEVQYDNNDAASTLADLAADAINSTIDFGAAAHDKVLIVANTLNGTSSNTATGSSGFLPYTLQQGSNENLIAVLTFEYDANDDLITITRSNS